MQNLTDEQVIGHRLMAHNLIRPLEGEDATLKAAGACGIQNTPPGALETALFQRVRGLVPERIQKAVEEEKTLLQAWSFRGAPFLFPAAQADAFLGALVSQEDEPWIYTRGIEAALTFLDLPFEPLLALARGAAKALETQTIKSKRALDAWFADGMELGIPSEKRALWRSPSMYGPGQSVGGAVASFLLRPCAFEGAVVFGKREGTSPSFTSPQNWLGSPLPMGGDRTKRLAQKYLHCYGPSKPAMFADFLGGSLEQAKRLWAGLELVEVQGRGFILAEDQEEFLSPQKPEREVMLLGPHDPYLDQRDRELILADKALRRKVWLTSGNPGVILQNGKIAGIWRSKRQGKKLELTATVWSEDRTVKEAVEREAEQLAEFWGHSLLTVSF